ncbi:MAG: T9SS type A sorting domain-containing protein [Ferruginibacter sp.]
MNYYRLKQIGLDGNFAYSEVRSVYFGNDVHIVLAPNPASDKVSVYLPGNKSNDEVNIYNVNGQLRKHVTLKKEILPIDLSGFSKGVYTMRINGKNINEVRKLLVN